MNDSFQWLISLLSLLIILLIGGFSFIAVNQIVTQDERPQPFCGVVDAVPDLTANHQGKKLFKMKCATCHNTNMKADMTGPALGGVMQRWNGDTTKLYSFIRNAVGYINTANDPYAIALYEKWNKSVMQSFPELTDEEIDAILVYIDNMYTH